MSDILRDTVRAARACQQCSHAHALALAPQFSLSSEYDLSGQVHLINRESNPKHSSSMTT